MTNLYDGKGYIPPDDPDTGEEYYRICVAVPRAMEYLVAFFGALEELGTWKLWARDPDHKGKIAAAVWKQANEITHANFAARECEGGMGTYRRVKPGEPWITEETRDDGVSWYPILIQPHWTGGDQGLPGGATEQSANDAGMILRRWYMWLIGYINDTMLPPVAWGTMQTDIVRMLTGGDVGDNPALDSAVMDLIEAVDDYGSAPSEELRDSECLWAPNHQYLKDELNQSGENWLDRLDEILAGILNEGAQEILDDLNTVANSMGADEWWNWVKNNANGDRSNGAGFGSTGDCDWLVYYAGEVDETVIANNNHPRVCHSVVFDVPVDYILRGLYLEYHASRGENPYTGMYLHVDPDCDPTPPTVALWEATSYMFEPGFNKALVTFDGDSETPFTINGLDISLKAENFASAMSEAARTGPKTFSAGVQWRSRLTEVITGVVTVTVVAQKEGL